VLQLIKDLNLGCIFDVRLKITIMKKIILVFSTIYLLSITTKAQDVNVGIKAGSNFTKIDGQSFNDGYKVSFQGGLFMELDFNKKVGIQPEFLYSETKSENAPGTLPYTFQNNNVNLQYLTIPVLFRYKIAKVLVLNVGPQYSFLLNKSENKLVGGSEPFKSADFAMIGGAQLNFRYLRVYGRYAIGLNNINDLSESNKWKSQQIQLGVGFKF
jgi:opacity protein-like surface antigen